MKAKWIWSRKETIRSYNQSIFAKKIVDLKNVRRAGLRITADSYYRLWINGVWVNDGPCRSWPEHYQYDELDVAAYLVPGHNEIKVLARYWGCGTFHSFPQQAGLLVELDVESKDGEHQWIGTDSSWEAAEMLAWQSNTAKVSIQMEPQEYFDARLESGVNYQPASVLFDASSGPWQDLNPRDVALLNRVPTAFRSFRTANVVRRSARLHYCLLAANLTHPELVDANMNTNTVGGMSVELQLEKSGEIAFETSGLKVFVDGLNNQTGRYLLQAGSHLVSAFVTDVTGHNKEKQVWITDFPADMKLVNPLQVDAENVWCWISFPEDAIVANDMRWVSFGMEADQAARVEGYLRKIETLGCSMVSTAALRDQIGERAVVLSSNRMFAQDDHWQFIQREVLFSAKNLVINPAGLIYDQAQLTVVHPSKDGDVELVYDLGEQAIGYYDLEIQADAGVIVDIYSVEYITPDGTIQHSLGNRNGMRYTCKSGWNRFTSTKRRSGRYVFVTLRNLVNPVSIRKIQIITSTYPVDEQGSFRCSDMRLQRIWEISAHTLKLCMEDTFTDCPLYEQTHWVGDARNESVFAYPVFGALDIGKRCIRLTAQSLERYPIVGCQVPSSWDCLLPAWSFLWGISVWDFYIFSADRDFLGELWPAVIRNLQGAEKLLDRHGLFSGPFWNMFDWTGIDDRHETVLHNSMLLVGAVDAAIRCGEVLGEKDTIVWLQKFGLDLRQNINQYWDSNKQSYPDSIYADGKVSDSTSQHTSFLGLLYDITRADQYDAALKNVLHPPDRMVLVGSPFAMMYFYEALEKEGYYAEIIRSIYDAYLPMLAVDATTVWETFASSVSNPSGFPTRSHAHAWSSAPVYFLNRIIAGIRSVEPGGTAFEISPWVEGLDWAQGCVATMHGRLAVSWRKENDILLVDVSAPAGTIVKLIENKSMLGLRCVMVEVGA